MYKLMALFLCESLSFLIVKCDFCTKYKSMTDTRKSMESNVKLMKEFGSIHFTVPNLKFIATKDKLYLYLKLDKVINNSLEEWVYEFDDCSSSQNCPKIGSEEEFSKVFSGLTNLREAFIHNGFTYLLTESSNKVFKFENTNKVQEIEGKDFWKNISHSTIYEWSGNNQNLKSRFIPPKPPKGPPLYKFSSDVIRGKESVELKGNYEMVTIVGDIQVFPKTAAKNWRNTFYTFGEYLVPTQFDGYLPLFNGDDIFNLDPMAIYIRKDQMTLHLYPEQDLYVMFGCKQNPIGERILTDTFNYMIYPVPTL